MMDVRKFALLVLDDFDKEIDRIDLHYAESPRNLGFELDFSSIESKSFVHFTSMRERRLSPNIVLNFLPPNAYKKLNSFKLFIQQNLRNRTVLEYDDTTGELKYIEGKVQRLGQEELTEWGGLVCPIVFTPSTPKYIRKDDVVLIGTHNSGKSYPYNYTYNYTNSTVSSQDIQNTYFDDVPMKVVVHGTVSNPVVALQDVVTEEIYSVVRFEGLYVGKGESLIIDSSQYKILLYSNGKYTSVYDYVGKQSHLDAFLFLRANSTSRVVFSIDPEEDGYLVGSYRQYVL